MTTNLMRFEDQDWVPRGMVQGHTIPRWDDYPTTSALIKGAKQTGARCAKNLFLKSQPTTLPQTWRPGGSGVATKHSISANR